MSRYHDGRAVLKEHVQNRLLGSMAPTGTMPTTGMISAASAEAEILLSDFEAGVLMHFRDTRAHGVAAYLIAVSQSIVAAVVFALLLAGWWFVDFGSRQGLRDLINGKDPAKVSASSTSQQEQKPAPSLATP